MAVEANTSQLIQEAATFPVCYDHFDVTRAVMLAIAISDVHFRAPTRIFDVGHILDNVARNHFMHLSVSRLALRLTASAQLIKD